MGPIVTIHKDKNKREIDYQPELVSLNRTGLILWMYFMRYDSAQTIQIHYKDLEERGKISKQEYLKGFKELENNCFLIQRAKSPTQREYDFYSSAQMAKSKYLVVPQKYKTISVIKSDKESEALKESKQSIEKFGF